MKNFNRENGIKWIGLLLVCAVFISSTFVTGCGKKSDNNRATAVSPDDGRGGRTSPDSNDQGYTDLLMTGINQSIDGSVELAVELFTPEGQQADPLYFGPVNAFGYLDYNGADFTECGFRAGFWDLQTVQPNGNYGSDQVSVFNWTGTVIEATRRGSGEVAIINIGYPEYLLTGIEFKEGQPREGLDGYTYHNSFSGGIMIESVDGYICQVGWGMWAEPRIVYFN